MSDIHIGIHKTAFLFGLLYVDERLWCYFGPFLLVIGLGEKA